MSTEPVPAIGLGTWQNTGPQCADSVVAALDVGYRHVDTAQMYGNEEQVGAGVERSPVPREEVLLATKVLPRNLSRDAVLRSTGENLEKLWTDYVDLLYVHWPSGDYDARETMSAFDQLVDEGKVRHVGVSNFTPDLVEEARRHCDHGVFANQVDRSVLQNTARTTFSSRRL